MSARIALALLAALLTAGPASAVSVSIVQVGGTGDASAARVGDTIVVSLVVTLEEGDVFTGFGASIQWDLEGSDVLDIVSASETGPLFLDGKRFWSISSRYRIGVPGGNSTLMEDGNSFPESFVGPTFVWGWELASPLGDLDGIVGPRTFSIGHAELVIREPGTTAVSYLTDDVWESIVFGQGDIEDGLVLYEELQVGTQVQASSLSILAVEAEAVPALGPMGLTIVATALAATGLQLTGRESARSRS